MSDQSSDVQLAADLARAAGDVLLALRAGGVFAGRALGAAGDATSNGLLMHALSARRPQDTVLSEESADDRLRLDSERVWIVDPLDGTREYSEGRHDWAVHVALAVGGTPAVAAVFLPEIGVLCSDNPPSTPAATGSAPRIAVSRSRPPVEADAAAVAVGGELVPMGSAGYKAMAVVRGEADAYVHSGGQYEWDSAAPVGVARAAGLHCSRIDGSPLVYNQPDVSLPDLVICRPELAGPILAAVAR